MGAQFQATHSLPHPVILDDVYGIAAYNLWSSHPDDDGAHTEVQSYHERRYKNIPPPSLGDDERRRGRRHHIRERTVDTMWEAEERMHSVLRRFYGITPEVAAKEQELKEQEVSRIKVMEWMKTSDVGYTTLLH